MIHSRRFSSGERLTAAIVISIAAHGVLVLVARAALESAPDPGPIAVTMLAEDAGSGAGGDPGGGSGNPGGTSDGGSADTGRGSGAPAGASAERAVSSLQAPMDPHDAESRPVPGPVALEGMGPRPRGPRSRRPPPAPVVRERRVEEVAPHVPGSERVARASRSDPVGVPVAAANQRAAELSSTPTAPHARGASMTSSGPVDVGGVAVARGAAAGSGDGMAGPGDAGRGGAGAGAGEGSGAGDGSGVGQGGDGLRAWCVACPAPAYPARARREGWQGTVDVELRVATDGSVEEASVGHSSGFAPLDHAAITVARRSRFRVPNGQELRGRLRYRFVLEASAVPRPL